MKWLLLLPGFLMAASAVAAAVTEAEVAAEEFVYEARVQRQMAELQSARDAAFLKKLEAEILMEELRIAEEERKTGISPANPAPASSTR